MRKSGLLLALAIIAILPASGVALAATIDCRAGAVFCFGTTGSDTIYVSEGGRDTVVCGGGTDRVYFDAPAFR